MTINILFKIINNKIIESVFIISILLFPVDSISKETDVELEEPLLTEEEIEVEGLRSRVNKERALWYYYHYH